MNRRMNFLLGLGVAVLLSRPASAQGDPKSAADAAAASGAGASPGGVGPAAPPNYRVHLRFDDDPGLFPGAAEIYCTKGEYQDGFIKYETCHKQNVEMYTNVAIKDGIVASLADFRALSFDVRQAVQRLEFFASARRAVKAKMAEAARNAKRTGNPLEYDEYKGLLRRINKEYKAAIIQCGDGGAAVKCPPLPAPDPDENAPAAPSAPPAKLPI